MKQSELVAEVAENAALSKTRADAAVKAVFRAIGDAAQRGDSIMISGFGNFRVKDRPARQGRNPTTGESVAIPARRVLTYKPAAALAQALNDQD